MSKLFLILRIVKYLAAATFIGCVWATVAPLAIIISFSVWVAVTAMTMGPIAVKVIN